MNLNAFGIGLAFAGVVFTGPAGFAQQATATAKPANCPAEGFSGGFSRGCPQKQFANPADISAMMAALPDKTLRHAAELAPCAGARPSRRLGSHFHPAGSEDG
jgi:hypothetical protein